MKYTRVVTCEGDALIRKSLKELRDELNPGLFWSIHRSTIVNANAIGSIGRDLRGRTVLRIKGREDKLIVSETYAHLFRQM